MSTFTSLLTADARAALRPRSWRAAPPVTDREAWSHLDPAQVGAVVAAAEGWRERVRENPPRLSLWHRYAQTGERQPYERAQHGLLGEVGAAALALAATGEESWRPVLADAIWRLCELSAWCLPSHYALPEDGSRPPLPIPGRDVLDLSDAYVGGMLAAVDSFAGDHLEEAFPGLRARVHAEIRRRVLVPWREEVYFWHGLEATPNNWAPWIVSNVLVCAAVLEEDPEVLAADAERALAILDRFRAGYAADGSCDEGATYWWWAGATMFEALEVLSGISGGAIDGRGVEPVAAMARFPMRMQIDADTQVNYSDGAASLPPNASWHLLARFGATVEDPQVIAHGRWMGARHGFRMPEQLAPLFLRTVLELRDPGWQESGPAAPGMPASWYAPGTETMVAREREGSAEGWFLAAKGGHNDVSHNHDDVGGVIASLDGAPVLIDAGVGVYRRATFEPVTRYSIWTMRSAFHSVPLPQPGTGLEPGRPAEPADDVEPWIAEVLAEAAAMDPGGIEQPPGEQHAARGTVFADDGAAASLQMDLAPAYPADAALASCLRTAVLERDPAAIAIRDAWRFSEPRRMALVLMTADAPEETGEAGTLRIGPAIARFDAERFDARWERIPVTGDDRLAAVWGEAVHRLILTQREAAEKGELEVRLIRG